VVNREARRIAPFVALRDRIKTVPRAGRWIFGRLVKSRRSGGGGEGGQGRSAGGAGVGGEGDAGEGAGARTGEDEEAGKQCALTALCRGAKAKRKY